MEYFVYVKVGHQIIILSIEFGISVKSFGRANGDTIREQTADERG